MTSDDEPTGFLGRLRDRKWIAWVAIIGLVVLAGGATFLGILLSSL